MAMQVAKSSRETWREPVQAPADVWAVRLAGFIAWLKVTAMVVVATAVPLFAGVVELTAGGAAQIPPLQLPLWQSALTLQVLPLAHLVAQLPPQSTSLSEPFFTLSSQAGFWQVLFEQTPLGHWDPFTQATQLPEALQT
jgi:hypothetical protein